MDGIMEAFHANRGGTDYLTCLNSIRSLNSPPVTSDNVFAPNNKITDLLTVKNSLKGEGGEFTTGATIMQQGPLSFSFPP